MAQRVEVEDGFEYELAVGFNDDAAFARAEADELLPFGGWVASLEVERHTLLLDAVDDRLRARDISVSVVLHAGLATPGHKIVAKIPTELPGVRRELVVRVHSPEEGWPAEALQVMSEHLVRIAHVHLAPADFTQVGLLRQRRVKHTVVPPGSLPVYLSFDHVQALDLSGSVLLSERSLLEVESIGPTPAALVNGSRVGDVVTFLTGEHDGGPAEGKREWARSLVTNTTWRERAPRASADVVPQSTTTAAHAAGTFAEFLRTDVLTDVRWRLPGNDPAISYNEAMSLPDKAQRHRAHRAHYGALADHRDAAVIGLGAAFSQPVVLPLRRAFATQESSSAMVRTTFQVFRNALPAFHRIHLERAEEQGGRYTLADVQAPPASSAPWTFERGQRTVVDVISRLVPRSSVEAVFADGRVDCTGEGARGSAATLVGDDGKGWISLPWNGTLNSLFTLAHETMHAVHIAANVDYESLPTLLRESVARLAEFALMSSGVIDHHTHWIRERWRSQFFRPAYQSVFEVLLRDGSVEHDAESMRAAYEVELRNTYGAGVQIHPEDGHEWVKARHLFRPFGLLDYPASFLIGSVLHRRVLAGESVAMLLAARSIDDLGDQLGLDFTVPSTYAPDLGELPPRAGKKGDAA